VWLKRFLTVAIFAATPVMADEMPHQTLTLERVFASPSLQGSAPRALKLSPDGTLLTSLRPRPDDRERFDLWAVDTTTGEARMLVDSTKFGGGEISEAEKMQRERARIGGTKGIVAYDWAPDGKSVLVPLDGDLFIADLNGDTRRLTQTPQGELDATISPKGGFVSFVRDQNLFVIDTATGVERRLTRDGGNALSWGVAEFVAQEEMDRTKGHWWSPDDSRIAVARVDESGVALVSRAAIGVEGTKIFDQRYPRAGAANAVVDLYVIKNDGRGVVKVDLGTNPDIYLARVDWAPDGKALYVQRQSRDQKTLDLLRVNPDTGSSSVVFTETSKTWLNLHDNLRVLADGSIFWSSERDGFSHLYRFQAGKWTQLTKGPWNVRTVISLDEATGRVVFTGNRETPIEQQLYAVSLKGGAVEQLSENGWWTCARSGARAESCAAAGDKLIITRSNQSQPDQSFLADMHGKRLSWIEQNALTDAHPYAPYVAAHVKADYFTVEGANGIKLQAKVLKPALTQGQRAPVFVTVYGGPGAGRQVTNAWSAPIEQYLVQHGWVVFSIDGRGTPDRGKAFEDPIYRAMSGVEVDDQLVGIEWLKKQDFVDPKRIAVYGWSYGGYMTLRLLERAPGVFAAGVSGAPVTKWELYDTHYTERYMGTPQADAEAYKKSSALESVTAIADPLLLIHGMADDNVVFENSTALMARLQQNAKPFEMMVYPGQTHRVAGPGVSVHLWRTILGFLDRTVSVKPN
jgi:dipeptidyl-peptidase 4